jgi:hypothetical protein
VIWRRESEQKFTDASEMRTVSIFRVKKISQENNHQEKKQQHLMVQEICPYEKFANSYQTARRRPIPEDTSSKLSTLTANILQQNYSFESFQPAFEAGHILPLVLVNHS